MAFDFQAYRNPYVSTIAELLSRGEDAKAKALVDVANAQARAAEIRGQAYGGAIDSVGKMVAGLPAQIQAGKDQAFKTAQQARFLQQQKLEDAAQARQDAARIKFSEFQANPNVTTVTPGQAGSLPDRMLPSLAPNTFVPDAQAPVGGTIGGFLNRANVFGGSLSNALPQDVPDARADMIPSVSMSGNAAPAPRLTPTMSVPETTNVTNTSKRMSVGDVNGLDLWDIDAYAKQMAAAGLSAEAQPSLALMRASNDDMEKHQASALAVARNDAARILKFADSQIPSAVDQLVEKYSNNGVFPTQQLEMVKQQIGAIKQLPQDQQLLAYKKLVQAVGDVTPKLVSLGVDQKLVDADTNEVVAQGAPSPKRAPTEVEVRLAAVNNDPVRYVQSEIDAADKLEKGRNARSNAALQNSWNIALNASKKQGMSWAKDADGQERYMTPDEIRSSGATRPDTADMRNKQVGRGNLARTVDEVQALSLSIIDKVGVKQRANAIKRGSAAVFGNDPAFKTYQDARLAIAGNLAVGQQGSRPSDADVIRIWLPLVPDAYADTRDSAMMKWRLVRSMSVLPTEEVVSPSTDLGANFADK